MIKADELTQWNNLNCINLVFAPRKWMKSAVFRNSRLSLVVASDVRRSENEEDPQQFGGVSPDTSNWPAESPLKFSETANDGAALR